MKVHDQANPMITGNFKQIKRLAQPCLRCGEYFVFPVGSHHICDQCKGMAGGLKLADWQQKMNNAVFVSQIMEDMKK